MATRLRIQFLDILVLALVLTLVGVSSWQVYGPRSAQERPAQVLIRTQNQELIYPLNEDRILSVAGPEGQTEIHIHDNSVHIHASPCKNQTCVAQGEIRHGGQWIACLPNMVFVRIEAVIEEEGMDAISW